MVRVLVCLLGYSHPIPVYSQWAVHRFGAAPERTDANGMCWSIARNQWEPLAHQQNVEHGEPLNILVEPKNFIIPTSAKGTLNCG